MTAVALAFQRLIAAELVRLPPNARVLSVGEGNGRHVLDLALAFPSLRFYACDIDIGRVRLDAQRSCPG